MSIKEKPCHFCSLCAKGLMMMQRGILCNKLGLTHLYCCAFFTIFKDSGVGFGRVNTTFRKMTDQFGLI